eukprot:TRINITY_DN31298_c0_g1_i1.p1 TRINITY_DN31298_c0_g1~~TRINITY_DN31298_c0_g1_i1.p1  ORF type:complete len:824 (-),score=168.37 TRINITY_DN31298_c0_g1_i1:227-2698(-)
MECSICLLRYSVSDREPQVLNCGHTFCKTCVGQLGVSGSVRCPNCRICSATSEIRVNFSLRDALIDAEGGAPSSGSAPVHIEAAPLDLSVRPEDVQVDISISSGNLAAFEGDEPNELDVFISVIPPEGRDRTPSDICCVVDVSTSMGTEAMAQDAAGVAISHGLELLDIVKHALRTIIHILGDQDRLAIVAYSNSSQVILELTPMSTEGRRQAEIQLNGMQPEGMTNLWAGLQQGIDLLANGREPGRLQHVMLLTDGIPNLNPPRGIVPMLKRLRDKAGGRLPCTVNTFGFGYELDSQLLDEIAALGSGSYAFIPDAGFVGTVFVNAVANILATMATSATLILEPVAGAVLSTSAVAGGLPAKAVGKTVQVELPSLQYGQRKDVMLRLGGLQDSSADAALNVTVKYDIRVSSEGEHAMATSEKKLVDIQGSCLDDVATTEHCCRVLFVEGVKQAMAMLKQTKLDQLQGKPLQLPAAQDHIQEMVATLFSGATASEYLTALCEDLSGQVAEAFSKEEWYAKWGVHYLPSLLCAHRSQQCNNFKDPGVQNYGGELFNDLRDKSDDIFCSIQAPLPKPKVVVATTATTSTITATPPAAAAASRGGAAPASAPTPPPVVNMAAYYDRYAGCIDGSSQVRLANGSCKCIADVVKGDLISALTPSSSSNSFRSSSSSSSDSSKMAACFAEVLCVVRTVAPQKKFALVQLPNGGPRLTPHHPVLSDADKTWRFPSDIAPVQELPCEAVFTFVLADGACAFLVENVPCASLGHGLAEATVQHHYLGSSRVLDDLRLFDGFSMGLIDLGPDSIVRDVETGLICQLKPTAPAM